MRVKIDNVNYFNLSDVLKDLATRIINWKIKTNLSICEDQIKYLYLKTYTDYEIDSSNKLFLELDPKNYTKKSFERNWGEYLFGAENGLLVLDDKNQPEIWFHPDFLPDSSKLKTGDLIIDVYQNTWLVDHSNKWISLDLHDNIIPYWTCQTAGYKKLLNKKTFQKFNLKGLALNEDSSWILHPRFIMNRFDENYQTKELKKDETLEYSLYYDDKIDICKIFMDDDWREMKTNLITSHIANKIGWDYIQHFNKKHEKTCQILVQISPMEQINPLNLNINILTFLFEY